MIAHDTFHLTAHVLRLQELMDQSRNDALGRRAAVSRWRRSDRRRSRRT